MKSYWGYSQFREKQLDIINAVLEGKDTVALLPTGGGKSVCFQVPALLLEGITIVISPLIALMKDQVEQLNKKNIKASAIYSGLPSREIDILLDNCIYGDVKLLYVSPERLKSDLFLHRAEKMNISLLVIDEAHCISQWGYDFRPPYLEIAAFKKQLSIPKIIALTATATPAVKEDIINKLELKTPAIFQKSFARKNISYSVRISENKEEKLVQILSSISGSAIIYVRSRGGTRQLAEKLNKKRISADFYHAGLDNATRAKKQDAWINNQIRIMVATNAFGMGIDKPDVRLVIHMELPDSLESYYQEAGRAGRDEKLAFAVLLFHPSDAILLKKKTEQAYPSPEFLKRVYQSLANYYKIAVGSSMLESYDFELESFAKAYNYNPIEAFAAIKKLEDEGLIQLNDSFFKPSKIMILLNHQDLYKYQVANAKLDTIIKALLRLYGGELYQEFVTISEYQLAKLTQLERSAVVDKLKYLDQSRVVVYDHQKEKPQLTFLTPRQDANKLSIDAKKLAERKRANLERVAYMVKYAENDHQCRTQIFQHYFGEASFMTCGNCDVCIERKKQNQTSMNMIMPAILKSIPQEGIDYESLKTKHASSGIQSFDEALREMYESKKIKVTSSGKINLS